MPRGFTVAIDGPVAAGKGTIAPRLAQRLNGFYLYTGAMYRCLALISLEKGIDPSDQEALVLLLPQVKIGFQDNKVFLNGKDVTLRIKGEDVAAISSKVAFIPEVREHMVKLQQEIAQTAVDEGKIVVAEGRDTGTRVFPNALLKVFLTASPEIRAQRRIAQIKEMRKNVDSEKVIEEVIRRDRRDLEREVDPLTSDPAKEGYFVLDNSELSEEETLKAIEEEIEKKK